jgi:hypothetical protein
VRLDLRLHDGDPRLGVFAVDLLAVVRLTLQCRGGVGAALQVERECRGHGGQHQVCARETRPAQRRDPKAVVGESPEGHWIVEEQPDYPAKERDGRPPHPAHSRRQAHTNNRHPSRGPRLATITDRQESGSEPEPGQEIALSGP